MHGFDYHDVEWRVWLYNLHYPLNVWQISFHRTLEGFEHRFSHKLGMKSKSQHTICYASGNNNHLLRLCHCWSRTTRKGQMYKNATKYKNVTKPRPPMLQLPIVWLSQARLFQPCYESINSSDYTRWLNLSKLRQRQLLRPSSYGCSGHAWTSDCQQCASSYQWYKYNDDLSEGLLVINDMSAKKTFVIDDLYGRWPVWLMTYVNDHLCGLSICWKYLPL